jgi:hypothetical protein
VRGWFGACVAASLLLAVGPAVADAHGPNAPVATSYLARITEVPAGLRAQVVDGYVRMWLRARPSMNVVVLDYRGAPYLRFTSTGVQVNENSSMYYLNQTPVAATPPADLSADTAPSWHRASRGDAYEWHDGRLQALASVALAPGTNYVGRWSIPLLVNGHRTAISGTLWHRNDPSLVWFWPIVVLLACVIAAWRVGSAELDARVARGLGCACLLGTLAADIGRSLHGRPGVSAFQWVELVFVAVFVCWGLRQVLFGEPGFFSYFVVGSVAVWEGLNLLPTLLNGYVLIALPAFGARVAAVVCLGCGVGIMWPMFRLADRRIDREPVPDDELDSDYLFERG